MPDGSNSLINISTGLQRINKQIDITDKLLQAIEPILIPYRKKDKWGFCTPDRKIVIDCIYDDAKPFSEGLAGVMIGDKWGFINKKGEKIIPFKYDETSTFSDGLVGVELNYKWGYINNLGEEIIPFIYMRNPLEASIFSEGLVAVEKNGKWGFINRFNETVIQFIYKEVIIPFKHEIALVELFDEDISIFINKIGVEIYADLPKNFWLRENLDVNYSPSRKCGFVDTNGHEVIPHIYDFASNFRNGLANVIVGDKNGYINKLVSNIGKIN